MKQHNAKMEKQAKAKGGFNKKYSPPAKPHKVKSGPKKG